MSKTIQGNTAPAKAEQLQNSYTELANIIGFAGQFGGAQVSKDTTLYFNLRWNLVSNQRNLLSQSYVEHGVIQTLVDQPVDDAYSKGFDIKTEQYNSEEIEQLQIYAEQSGLQRALIQALKWARLFGGGAVLLITNQDPATKFNIESITESSKIKYRAVDMWELYEDRLNIQGTYTLDEESEYYTYYGKKVHKSRVLRVEGKEPPSFIRPRLRGWGMSEIERLVRSINQYMKNQDVTFDLLDEAKIDVFGMEGLNAALIDSGGTQTVATRLQNTNMLKNYNNALIMDKEDTYDQKTMTFAGLSDILTQIRQGLAADVKMPMTKLFGISSSGFNSGEDDIENYNSMIESEVRAKSRFLLVDLMKIASMHLYGSAPEDMMVTFPSLRVLSAKEEEEVKTNKYNRVVSAYQIGLISAEEAKDAINKDDLLPIEIEPDGEVREPFSEDFTVSDSKAEG